MKRLLLGVGNTLSHDDGVGPRVARALRGDASWVAVDVGAALENACGIVVRERPTLLVIVDAARMGLPAGSIRRLPVEARQTMLASTHGLPIAFVWERLTSAVSVGRSLLIGVEPADLSFGEGLSPTVAEAAETLVSRLRRGDLDGIPELAGS
jgi:hydrogenase 3 maturation protease